VFRGAASLHCEEYLLRCRDGSMNDLVTWSPIGEHVKIEWVNDGLKMA
jgi:hypothetical protein